GDSGDTDLPALTGSRVRPSAGQPVKCRALPRSGKPRNADFHGVGEWWSGERLVVSDQPRRVFPSITQIKATVHLRLVTDQSPLTTHHSPDYVRPLDAAGQAAVRHRGIPATAA